MLLLFRSAFRSWHSGILTSCHTLDCVLSVFCTRHACIILLPFRHSFYRTTTYHLRVLRFLLVSLPGAFPGGDSTTCACLPPACAHRVPFRLLFYFLLLPFCRFPVNTTCYLRFGLVLGFHCHALPATTCCHCLLLPSHTTPRTAACRTPALLLPVYWLPPPWFVLHCLPAFFTCFLCCFLYHKTIYHIFVCGFTLACVFY